MSLLNREQREFIEKYGKQGKKSKWIEAIARRKGIIVTEETPYEEIEPLVDDWVLVDVLDSGFGNRHYRCECGRSLRFQYRVLHKKEQKEYGYGVSCFEQHTNLSPDIVKDILKGFHTIDLERDEVLIKFSQGEHWNIKPYLHIENIPNEIVEQDRLGLPLTDKQKEKVLRLIEAYKEEQLFKKAYGLMDEKQKELFHSIRNKEQQELIIKLLDKEENEFRELPEGFIDEEIQQFHQAGLPFLNRHLDRIEEYLWNQREIPSKDVIQDGWYYFKKEDIHSPPELLEKIDYQTVIDRHLDTLKSVRAHEQKLSTGLKRDWKTIEDGVRQLKKGEDFDYSSFKLNLVNICYALRIDPDAFL